MRRMVEKLLVQYGRPVEVGQRQVRALFQPVTGKLERLADREPGILGLVSPKRYLYIGPVEPGPVEDGELTVDGKGYLVRSVQYIDGDSGPLYSWAMCVEKGRSDTWGMSC